MNQKTPADMRETLSALVDGESSEWELRKILQQSDSSNAAKEDWHSYQTIGAILRKEPNQSSENFVDISSSIMATLDDEPAYTKISYFKRTLGQTAIAASVAVIALVGIQQYQVAQNDIGSSNAIAETEIQLDNEALVFPPEGYQFQAPTSLVSTGAQAPSQSARVQIPIDRQQLELHFNELIQEHSVNSVNSAQDSMPMIRVPAGSDSE